MPCVKVTNISELCTQENLQELFQCCGEIQQLRFLVEGGRKIAVLDFLDQHHVEMALMLNGTELGDKQLVVSGLEAEEGKTLLDKKAQPKKLTEYEKACKKMREMMQGPTDAQEVRNGEVKRTIYVGNLSKQCTPAMLREEFSKIAEVVYIKFSEDLSKNGNADFRYAFIEFATEQQARLAFTYHGKVIAGQAIKIGTAHNPIFKEAGDVDNPLWHAKKAAETLKNRFKPKKKARDSRKRSRSRERTRRKRRRKKRRRRGSRSRERDDDDGDGEKPKMFWDGYQWHFNNSNEDLEEQVTSIIRSDTDAKIETAVDTKKKMQDAAQAALRNLRMTKSIL